MGRLTTPLARPLLAIPLAFGSATSTRLRQTATNADSVLDTAGTASPGSSFTIGMLVQATTLTSGRQLWCRDNSSSGHHLDVSGTAGAVSFAYSRGGGATNDTITSSTGVLKLNKWAFVFVVRDATAATFLSLYHGSIARSIVKDSVTGTNGSGTIDADDSGRLTTIGNDFNGSPTVSFQGRIALAVRFTRALALGELQAIRQAVLDGDVTPIGWLPGCVELVVPGEHGAGVRVNHYGRESGLAFTQTGTKPCARGSWPVLEKDRRRRTLRLASGIAYSQSVAGALTPSGTLLKTTGKPLTGPLTPGAALTKAVARALSGGLTPVGAVPKQPARALTGALTPGAGASGVKVALAAVSGALTPGGTLAKGAAKPLSGTLASAGAVTRAVARALAGALTPAATLVRAVGKALAGALTPSGVGAGAKVTGTTTNQSVSGAVTPTAALAGDGQAGTGDPRSHVRDRRWPRRWRFL